MNEMYMMNSFWVSRLKKCFVCDFGYKTNLELGKWVVLHSFAFILFIVAPFDMLFDEYDEYRCTFMLFKAFFCNALILEGFRVLEMINLVFQSSSLRKINHLVQSLSE